VGVRTSKLNIGTQPKKSHKQSGSENYPFIKTTSVPQNSRLTQLPPTNTNIIFWIASKIMQINLRKLRSTHAD